MEISGHRYYTITILTVWGHVTFKCQQAIVVELSWPHSIARFPKPPIRRKDFGDVSYSIQIIALSFQISWPWQQGLVGVKFHWQYLMAQH